MRYHFLIVAVSLGSLLLSSCSSGNAGGDPKEVAQAWVDAVNAKDFEKCRAYVVSAAKNLFEEAPRGSTGWDCSGFILGEVSFTAKGADVAVELSEEKGEASEGGKVKAIMLEKEGGHWRVSGSKVSFGKMTIPMPFQATIEMGNAIGEALSTGINAEFQESFNTIQQDLDRGGSVEELTKEANLYTTYSPMDPIKYAVSWINMKDYSGSSALEATRALAKEIGLAVHPGEHKAALAHTLTKGLTDLTFLEAINQAASEAGLMARFPVRVGQEKYSPAFYADGPLPERDSDDFFMEDLPDSLNKQAIQFTAGERRYPLTFFGPYVMGVKRLEEQVSYGLGELEVLALGYGVPPLIAELADEESTWLTISEVHAPSGSDLRRRLGKQHYSFNNYYDGISEFEGRAKLFGLHQGVDVVGKVKSEFTLPLPQKVAAVQFEKLEVGTIETQDDMTFEIMEIGEQRIQIKVDWPGVKEAFYPPNEDIYKQGPPPSAKIFALAVGEDGLPVGFTWDVIRQSRDKSIVYHLTKKLPISRLTLHVFRDIERVPHIFRLKNIPLEQSNERPEKFVELAYAQHESPISLEVLSAEYVPNETFPNQKGDAKVMVRITNHSNKGIMEIHGGSQYFDERMDEIDSSMFTIEEKGESNESAPRLLAGPGTTRELETRQSFAAPKMKLVRLKIRYVLFMDGTYWHDNKGYFKILPEQEHPACT